MINDKHDKPLGVLFSDLTRETLDLVRQEIALGRAEISQKVTSAQTGLTSVAVGGAVLFAGLLVVLLAIVNALAMILPPENAAWLAPLIVGVVVAAIGYGMLKNGSTRLKPDHLVPHRTLHSLARDGRVMKERTQ